MSASAIGSHIKLTGQKLTFRIFKRQLVRILTVTFILICILLGASACFDNKTSGNFSLLNRATLIAVRTVGSINVTAHCHPREQLTGGGYVIEQPPLGKSGSPLIIEASYPSTPDAWTVSVFNSDPDENGPSKGALIRVDAYCLTTPSFLVGIKIVRSVATVPVFSRVTTAIANCPTGSIVMGGGFKTDHAFTQFLDSASLLASAPSLDNIQKPTGWRVKQYGWVPPPSTPTITAYALCATENLTMGTFSSVSVPPVNRFGFRYHEGQASCHEDEFTAGGGYEFIGDPLVPHFINYNVAVKKFSAWGEKGVYGHDTGIAAEDVRAWAMCIKLPRIELAVRITSPGDGSLLPTARGGTLTEPVTFTAIATNASGALASGINFQWTDNGNVFGVPNATFSTTLSASDCTYHHIIVTATDSVGNSASDSIIISTGDCQVE